MKLIQTSFFSGLITIIRVSSGFVASKVIAIVTGAAGVALIGAFSNFISIVLTFANGAINTGVVKYTAEFEGKNDELKSLISTSFQITLFCSFVIGVTMFTLSSYISEWIFAEQIYGGPIRILGISILFYSLNSLLISILNGLKQIKTYTIVNTVGSIVGLIFTVLLVYLYKIQGALYSLVLSQSVVFFVTVILILKKPWLSWDYFNQGFDKLIALKLTRFSMMSIVSALTLPVSQIILRNLLITKLGIFDAGIWQGMMRISDAYLMIITTSLSTYYLPKLASLKTDNELRTEILKGYKIILPVVLLSCIIIYLLRNVIINFLFTSDFKIMEELFYWQLIGDFFKVSAWVLAYLMLAKAMTKMYIISEIAFSLGYVIVSYFLINIFQIQGIVIAFALNYLFYFVFMLIIFRKILFKKYLLK